MTRNDKLQLLAIPAFRRFCLDLVVKAGIFGAADSDAEGRDLVAEGRRGLGLDVLRDLDSAQPLRGAEDGIPVGVLIQLFHEAAQADPKEKTRAETNDAYAELDEDPPA